MKKTINISLGGYQFTLEDDAYLLLETYLNKVKAHFVPYSDAVEIVNDIESRLAEQLSVRPKDKVVSLEEVEKLIAVMGSPEQFEAGPASEETQKGKQAFQKRMYRNPDDIIIAGVASGIAAYLGIDALWVRLAFIASLFAGGLGVAIYIVLWIILPEAKTETEKMQMRGQRINLANLEETIKERIEEVKHKDRSAVKKNLKGLGDLLRTGIQTLIKLIGFLTRIILKLVGAILAIGSIIAAATLVFGLVSLLFNANSPYIEFPFLELSKSGWYYATIISTFFVIFVPLVFLTLLGSTILSNKITFSKKTAFPLMGLWLVSAIVGASGGLHMAPQVKNIVETSPYFQTTSTRIDAKDFTKIRLENDIDAAIVSGSDFFVEVEGQRNDLENIQVYVENGVLNGETTRQNNRICLFCFHKPIKMTVHAPVIESADLEGASKAKLENLKGKAFTLELSGASSADIEAGLENLEAKISGASNMKLVGVATNVKIGLSGASNVLASGAQATNVEIIASGASSARFGVLERLKATASGASLIQYISVGTLEKHSSGASKIIPTSQFNRFYEAEQAQPAMPQKPEITD